MSALGHYKKPDENFGFFMPGASLGMEEKQLSGVLMPWPYHSDC